MNIGGVQTFIINISRYLASVGCEIIVLTTTDKGKWWQLLDDNGIKGINLQQSRYFSPVTQAVNFARIILEENIDILLLNHSRPGQLAIPLYSYNCVTIPIIHNDTRGIMLRALQNCIFVDSVVCVSPKLYSDARNYFASDSVVQINYPVRFPSESEFKSEREVLGDKLRILYVGRVNEDQKGVFILPQIIKECQARGLNVSLTIAGGGEDMFRLQKMFSDLELDGFVSFVGYKRQDEILFSMLKHHVLLMPSHYEGLGIVAVEAQGCGCVPIASRLAGVTDHSVKNGESGFLVKDRNPNVWVDHIETLFVDKALWMRCSTYGRKYVKEKFSVETVGDIYFKHIGSIKKRKICELKIYRYSKFLIGTNWRDWVPNLFRTRRF